MQAFPVDSADGDREDRVGVPIEVALVLYATPVARGKDEQRPFPASSLVDSVHHRLENEAFRRFHRFAIVRRTPRARIDVVLLVRVVEGRRLVRVGYWRRQYTHTSYLGGVRDSHTADVVLDRGNLTRASRAVLIVR